MSFQDFKKSGAEQQQAQNGQQEKKEQKPAPVELAVFNLESVVTVTDHQMMANQIQRFLHSCGNTNLAQLQPKANVPMVANVFALTGSVLDLILYALVPKQGELGVQQSALLSINLIGLFLAPQAEAHVRMALRPMLGLMADCLYKENGKIREGDIKRMALHLNAKMAGDIGKFLLDTSGKLGGLLASASALGAQILATLAAPTVSLGAVAALAGGGGGASADTRDPNQQFTNWASPLIDLIATPSVANLTPKMPALLGSHLQISATQALTSLSSAIQQQSNSGLKYSVAWLISETRKAIEALGGAISASVPITQTGELERHTIGDTLEFVSLQADALSAPPCEGPDSQTEDSISYSIGAERVNHADFYLPKLGFAFSRQYNSQLEEFDDSMMGSRWMMPFSNQIIQNKQGYLFIDAKGRKHQFPSSILYEAYHAPFEGLIVEVIENGDLVLNFGGAWDFQFHSFNGGRHYHLVLQSNETTQEQVVLNYLLVNQTAYLQTVDFQLKITQQSLKFAYNEQLKIIAIFVDEQAEPLARYQYDQQGNLVKAYDQNGHLRSYYYNSNHQLTRYSDRTGRGQNIRYESTSAQAKAVEEWADDGSFKTRLEWHPRLRQVAVYDAYEVPTYYYFDLDGFTYRTRLADGRESWFSRDKHKRITRQIDFEARETQQEYNDQDQLVKIVQPNGGVIRFAYDEQGNLTETKDPEGNLWKKEYDADGNISKEINPLGHSTQYKYNNEHQLIEVIDAKGGSKKIQYNDLGQMISYSDCSGKESAWEYDEDGTLNAQQSADAQKVQYLYSESGKDKGQLQAIIYPDGLKEQFEHDQEGRLLKHTNTKGLSTHYTYNAVGLLQQRIDANRHQIGYQWDNQGRIKKLINQNHAEYLFDYNHYGQLIREQAFDGEEKHYNYSENGRLFQIRQPNTLTQFGYHADGKIASKTYSHLETRHTQTEEFEYNLNNQLSKVSNLDSQNDFYRNALGQLVREHQHYKVPNLSPMTAVLRYEYDELGNLSKTIRPDGQEQSNLSYGSGHIYGVAFNQQDMVAFKRDDLHRETARFLANGLVQSKNYNDVGLLSSQLIQAEQETTNQLHQAERHYQYDKNYLLTQVDDSRLGKLNYQYDPIGRLIKSQNPQNTENFAFDPAGNLIDPIATQTSQIKNNLIQQYQGKYYKYDAQGNVIETTQAGKTLKLTWDNLNRLIQSEHNGQITTYGYDVFGRRLYKNSHVNSQNQLTLFGWDGDLMVWESLQSNKAQENAKHNVEQNQQNNYTKHYVYEPNSFVPLFQTGYAGFIKLIETPDYNRFKTEAYSIQKDPVWRNDTRRNRAELERVAFYHCDQVGTPQTLSNELGECVWEIKQNTWGTALEINTTNPDNPLEQSNIRFQGQYYDEETELHYNRYRYYEPYSARYVSKDPIGLMGGLNNTKYVSDPNQWVDPMGLAGIWTNGKGEFSGTKKGPDWYPSNGDNEAKQIQSNLYRVKSDQLKYEELRVKNQEHWDWQKQQEEIWNKDPIGNKKLHDKQIADYEQAQKIYKNFINNQKSLCEEQLVEYVTCSAGIGPKAIGFSINLYNGRVFKAEDAYSGTAVPIGVEKTMAMGPQSLKNASKALSKNVLTAGASCVGGHIVNKEIVNDVARNTDNFLTGKAYSFSVGASIFKGGVTVADPDKLFDGAAQKGLEFGLQLPTGFGADLSVAEGKATNIKLK